MNVSKAHPVSRLRWQVFISLFAAYLMVHFFDLLFYAEELFSNTGIFPHAQDLPTYPYGLSILFIFDTAWFAQIFVLLLLIASIGLAFQKTRMVSSLILCIGWSGLLCRNPFIRNPGMPYVGWMLLAIALTSWWNGKNTWKQWNFPPQLFWLAWFLLGMGYTISGFHKLSSPSWQNGLALSFLLENPLSRPGLISEIVASLPTWTFKVQTWGALLLEISAGFLFLSKKTRMWAWLALVSMHLGIVMLVDFVDLTLGMLLIHFFVFDERWIRRKGSEGVVFFDGTCNMCDGFVQTLLPHLRADTLKFASLQSNYAQSNLTLQNIPDSIVYLADDNTMFKSDAVIAILRRCGGFLRLLGECIAIIPTPLRDAAYVFIARNRYKVFGKKESCRMPTKEERDFFIS